MEYLLKSSIYESFVINGGYYPNNYVPIENNGYVEVDLSFLDNYLNVYDLVTNAVIHFSKDTLPLSQYKNVRIFYFDDDGTTKIYVDYGFPHNDFFLSFNISELFFTKKYKNKTLYLENLN